GAKVAILGRRVEKAEAVVAQIQDVGGEALAAPADVMVHTELAEARDAVLAKWGRIDILINGAGGTTPQATVPTDKNIFDMALEPMREVIDLNLIGTLLPSQIIGSALAQQRQGCI